jgi:hypothetical protein
MHGNTKVFDIVPGVLEASEAIGYLDLICHRMFGNYTCRLKRCHELLLLLVVELVDEVDLEDDDGSEEDEDDDCDCASFRAFSAAFCPASGSFTDSSSSLPSAVRDGRS